MSKISQRRMMLTAIQHIEVLAYKAVLHQSSLDKAGLVEIAAEIKALATKAIKKLDDDGGAASEAMWQHRMAHGTKD